MSRGYRFTVTVERATVDQYGAPHTPATHQVHGCYDEPTSMSETAGAFLQLVEGRSLTAPAGSNIVEGDTLVYPNGSRWHVVGVPYDWSNPHVRHRPGLEVQLQKTT